MKCSVLVGFLALLGAGFVQGQVGCYMSFAGYDYMSIAPFPLNSTFTVEMWMKLQNINFYQYFFSYIGSASETNTLNLMVKDINATSHVNSNGWNSFYRYNVSQWFHLAWTFDTRVQRVYINGVLKVSYTLAAQKINSGGRLVIGQKAVWAGTGFDRTLSYVGSIDEIRVWNFTRTATQILNNYNASLTGNEANLTLYYPFSSCNQPNFGTILPDATGRFNANYDCVGCAIDTYGEFAALWQLFWATGGDSTWAVAANWTAPDPANHPCSSIRPWYGVVCVNNRVTQLNLGFNKLNGTIPDGIFANFTQLQYLFLHNNNISGSIPSSIGNLTALTHLYLMGNNFTGTIPSTIGNMKNSVKILLRNNKLTGDVPLALSQLTKLQTFDASYNLLNGQLFSGLPNATSLLSLNLTGNQLNGKLPNDLLSHPSLKFLDLSNNSFTGAIPEQISQNDFQQINIANNNFKCQMPAFMYTYLQYSMNVFNNSFWCPITGSSPSVFGASCTPLVISSAVPSSVIATDPTGSVNITLAVPGLQDCNDIQCYFSNSSGVNSTIVTATYNNTHVSCPLPASSPRETRISLYFKGVQVSSNVALFSYYLECQCVDLLHGRCDPISGICTCFTNYTGSNCSLLRCPKDCSGHGTCNYTTGQCVCDTHYTGEICATVYLPCTNNCTSPSKGTCDTTKGKCVCQQRFWGEDCSNQACPPYNPPYCNELNGGGTCNGTTGLCQCNSNWLEPNCAVATKNCTNDCTSTVNGQCDKSTGICNCFYPYAGEDCSLRQCARNCSYPNGVCNQHTGNCTCGLYYNSTEDCSVYKTNCPNECTSLDHGSCNTLTGACVCTANYTGSDCSGRKCPGDANNFCSFPNGKCDNTTGVCVCNSNYTGSFCQIANKTCPNDCTSSKNYGICNKNTGECLCIAPATGVDCSSLSCRNNCSGNGYCDGVTGKCVCDLGWGLSPDCSVASQFCTWPCNEVGGGGYCNNFTGSCVCNSGWTSADLDPEWTGQRCTVKTCPGVPPCNSPTGGQCNTTNGLCVCNQYWIGINCGVANHTCDGGCSEPNGQCLLTSGECKCYGSRTGKSCELTSCLNNCTSPSKGQCNYTTGVCQCINGWQGSDCTTKVCPNFCSSSRNGKCDYSTGICSCNAGFAGEDCAQLLCLKFNNCSSHGLCDPKTGMCMCDLNYISDTCSIGNFSCPNGCSGSHGLCNSLTGNCTCGVNYEGTDCSRTRCNPPDCNSNGVCNYNTGVCACATNWTGAVCLTANLPCPNNCSGAGTCDTLRGVCNCNMSTTLTDCSGKQCEQNCSGHGNCNYMSGLCLCQDGWMGASCNYQKENTQNIALQAGLGGAGVILVSGAVFYIIRRHQIKKLKALKAAKMAAMQSMASSGGISHSAPSHQVPDSPSL